MLVDIVDLPGFQHYALFANEDGGIIDDLMVANTGDHFFLVVNAACKDQGRAHLRPHLVPSSKKTKATLNR